MSLDETCRRRIASLVFPSPETKERARDLLEQWCREVQEETGKTLPVPFIFGAGDGDGSVEFRWETGHREVEVTVEEFGPLRFWAKDKKTGQDELEEAWENEVADWLEWMMEGQG